MLLQCVVKGELDPIKIREALGRVASELIKDGKINLKDLTSKEGTNE